ncbi:shikimate kinase I [Piscinibacter sakaiensis]|uniref:Shikimate kinase n=1 Tax=Piscinibacter sakaiensis TaxID=1547922 RepID=A0A0K8NWM8_PISS1|nr:shikimate kinase I [Piscinibacter sakaiensis]
MGLPGSGKTTVGRQLARRLGWGLVDLDAQIEQQIGCSIRDYFAEVGEASFRELEAQALEHALQQPRQIVSTGGGIVLRDDNRRALGSRSVCLYLRCRPDELFRRLRHDRQRPLLQVGNPLQKLRELQSQREPLYERVAHFSFETGRASINTLVNMVLMQLELAGVVGPERVPSSIDAPAAQPTAAA